MSAWGKGGGGGLRSCDGLMKRIEENDPKLVELVILPMKSFGTKDVQQLAKALQQQQQNTNLKSISASGHKLTPDSLREIGQAVGCSCSITSLAIGDHTMGDVGVMALCEGLVEAATATTKSSSSSSSSPSCKLEFIDLSWKGIGKEGMNSIVGTLLNDQICPSLRHLILSRNNLSGFEFDDNNTTTTNTAATTKSFVTFSSKLQQLELSDCSLDGDSNFCQGLVSRLLLQQKNNNNNLILNLSFNERLGSSNTTMTALSTLSSLVELNLEGCSIDDEGLRIFIERFPSSPSSTGGTTIPATTTSSKLRRLNLSNNKITPNGIRFLAQSLQSLHKIQEEGNDIIKSHILSELQELNLSANKLNEDCTKTFAQAFIAYNNNVNTTDTNGLLLPLTKLDMTGTSCGVGGVIDLLQISSLKELIVFNNQLGSDGFVMLAKHLIGGHPTLHTLDVGGNGATEAGVVALLQSLTTTCSKGVKNSLNLLVIGGNETGPTVETVCKEIKSILPEIDIARDKPKKQQNQLQQQFNSF